MQAAYNPPARFSVALNFSRIASRLEMAARRGPGWFVVRETADVSLQEDFGV
jgi:hypothetical protein